MNEQDRQAIDGVFQRLEQLERAGHGRDESADTFIRDRMAQQPGAAYYLAQTVVVQEHALNTAQQRIIELERQAAQAPARTGSGLDYSFGRSAGATAAATSAGTAGATLGAFPGSASGAASGATSGAAPGPASGLQAAPGSPGTPGALAGIGERLGFGAKAGDQTTPGAPGAPAGPAPARAGGGFLAGAMQTAMGVAGGMMLGNMLGGLFGGKDANAATPPAEATHNYASGQGDNASASSTDGGAQSQDVGWDDGMGMDDGGGFDGGFDDI